MEINTGRALKAARLRAGLTLDVAAARLGVAQRSIGAPERARDCRVSTLVRAAALYQVDPIEVLREALAGEVTCVACQKPRTDDARPCARCGAT